MKVPQAVIAGCREWMGCFLDKGCWLVVQGNCISSLHGAKEGFCDGHGKIRKTDDDMRAMVGYICGRQVPC